MKQVTLRLPDELASALKQEAARSGQSLNALAARGLGALVDPALEGDEVERMRARLRRAGLLVEPAPAPLERPAEAKLAEARAAAGRGTPLSELVSEGRGPR